jgi:hypothetical protein
MRVKYHLQYHSFQKLICLSSFSRPNVIYVWTEQSSLLNQVTPPSIHPSIIHPSIHTFINPPIHQNQLCDHSTFFILNFLTPVQNPVQSITFNISLFLIIILLLYYFFICFMCVAAGRRAHQSLTLGQVMSKLF